MSRFKFLLLAALCTCTTALAQTSNWTGLGLTNVEWSDSANWDIVPGTSSNVYFDNVTPINSDIDSNTTVANIFIQGSVLGTLNLTSTGNFTLNSAIYDEAAGLNTTVSVAIVNTVQGVFVNAAGGTLTLSNAANNLGAVYVLNGTLSDGVAGAYSGSQGLAVDSPGIIDVHFNESAGYLSDYTTGLGSVVIDPGATLTLNNNYSTTFSGVVSGAGNLSKTATSTMTLTGANTYTGTTNIGAGATIELGNNGTTGSLSASTIVSGPGVLEFYLTGTPAPAQENLTGQLNVVLHSGSGTVQLAGTNTYSGPTTVNGGTLQAGSTSAFGNGASAVTVMSGGTLDLNSFNNTIGTLTLNSGGSVSLGAGTLTVNSVGSSIVAGTIGGLGGLTVNTYQFIVQGANTYTGPTSISGGTFEADNSTGYANGTGSASVLINSGGILQIGSGNTFGFINPSSVIIDNGTLTFVRSDPIVFSNSISGTGGIEKVATTDTVTLSGNNTFSGTIDLFGGTFQAGVGQTHAFGTGAAVQFDSASTTLDLNNNNESVGSISMGDATNTINLGTGHLTLTVPASTTFGGVIQGTGALSTAESQLTLTGASTYIGGTTIVNGSLVADNATGSATGSGNITISAGTALKIGANDGQGGVSATTVFDSGTILFNRTDAAIFSSNITGTGGIELVSPAGSSVTVTGTNTYSGTTDIENGGSLYAGSAASFGTGTSALLVNNGGLFIMQGFNLAFGSLSGDQSGQIQNGGGTLTVGGSNSNSNSGTSISGTGGLVKTGTGTLTLSGTSSFSGGTVVQQGYLADSAADAYSPASVLALGGALGGTVDVNYNESVKGIADIGGIPGAIYAATGAQLTITGSSDFATTIAGGGGVTVNVPASTVTFEGTNTYSGNTIVNQGSLEDGVALAFSPNSAVFVNSGAGLNANNNEVVGNLESTTPGGNVSISSPNTFTSMGLNYTNDFQGVISGNGEFIVGDGVQGLSGNNTYTGGTFVTGGGELFVGSNAALGTGTATFDNGTEFSPDANVTLANNIILTNGEVLDNDDGGNNNMTLNGVISETSGTGSIVWCTTGTLTLNAANTFTGGVDMREGNLVLGNDSAAGSGAITLNNVSSLNVMTGVTTTNALNLTGTTVTLAGSGTIATSVMAGSNVVISPSASPGNGPGTLTFSSGLTFGTGSAIHFDLYDATGAAGTGYGLISATGGLNLTASANTITFNIVSTDAAGNATSAIHLNAGTPYSWTFATSSTAITGFSANQFNIDTSGLQNSIGAGVFDVSEVGNSLQLNFTPVPEPSTWCLIGVGALSLFALGSSRRHRHGMTG